jgi:hypothetical protein
MRDLKLPKQNRRTSLLRRVWFPAHGISWLIACIVLSLGPIEEREFQADLAQFLDNLTIREIKDKGVCLTAANQARLRDKFGTC